MPPKDNEPIPNKINKQYKEFQFWQRFWFTVHYLSGIFAVIAGGLATAAGTDSGPKFIHNLIWVWGSIASLLSGIVTFLGPLQKAESYKHAYYRLSSGIARYEANEMNIKDLLDIYERAQNVVLLGDPTAAQKPPDKKLKV